MISPPTAVPGIIMLLAEYATWEGRAARVRVAMSLCEDDGVASGSARASRPGSLALDGAQPEKEPLQFDVQLVGAPPEVEQLVNNIKQVAEDFLYHWKTFPIGELKVWICVGCHLNFVLFV